MEQPRQAQGVPPGALTAARRASRIIATPHEENALAGQPKKRIPRAAQGERRSHLALRAMNLVPCPQCKSPKPPHQACPHCGMFRGRQVIPIKAKRTPA